MIDVRSVSRRTALLWTAIAAVTARVIMLFDVSSSPYRLYHLVHGLDMETLLAFSHPDSYPMLFIPQRLMLFFFRTCSGGADIPMLMFIFQSMLGVLSAVIVADLTCRFFGNRFAGLFSGVVSALYGPYLMYECTLLQESLMMGIFLIAIWLFFYARSKRFSYWIAAVSGVALAVCSAGRPIYVLPAVFMMGWSFFLDRRHLHRTGAMVYSGTAIAGYAVIALFNHCMAGTWNIFPTAVSYVMASNAAASGQGASAGVATTAWTALGRLPYLLSATEIAENLNFYFIMTRIPMLRLLPRPEGIVPMAIMGTLLMFYRWNFKKAALFPLIMLLLIAPAVCCRFPSGRYRLLLTPYLIMMAGYVAVFFSERRETLNMFVGVAIVLVVIAVSYRCSPSSGLRGGDYVAWGQACKADGRSAEAVAAYDTAWTRFYSREGAVNLFTETIMAHRTDVALGICRRYLAVHPFDPLFNFYHALTLSMLGRRDEALIALDCVVTDDAVLAHRRDMLRRRLR
ncbi:MAG: hypothetical protein MJ025_02620 [Victivallaceae bacterium]|nr:hypothetical protein [Victivallaceae bacterium]